MEEAWSGAQMFLTESGIRRTNQAERSQRATVL